MKPISPCIALVLDGIGSGAMALPLALAAGPPSPLLGLPETLLRVVGLALLPYAVLLLAIGARPLVAQRVISLVIAGNIAWIGASLVLLLSSWVTPTIPGQAFIIAQALAVAAFMLLQMVAGRQRNLSAA